MGGGGSLPSETCFYGESMCLNLNKRTLFKSVFSLKELPHDSLDFKISSKCIVFEKESTFKH